MKKIWFFVQFVVALLLLVWLFMPGTQQARIGSRPKCLNNMRNAGVAIQIYATDHRGDIPATEGGHPPHSWRVDLLPYLEQSALRQRYDDTEFWNVGENREITKSQLQVYQCPDAPVSTTSEGYALTAYATITGTNAMWRKKNSQQLSVISGGDGLSQTLMIVEACGQNIAWSEPRDVDLDSMRVGINLPNQKSGQPNSLLSSYHQSGANVVFGDGSARYLPESIDPEILKKLCTATGGEMLTGSDY